MPSLKRLITLVCFTFIAFSNNASASSVQDKCSIEFDCPDSALFAITYSTCGTEFINLNIYLPATADPTGIWTSPFGNLVSGGWVSSAADVPGVYSYSWIDSDGCLLYGTLALIFTADSDSDGICDDSEIAGCQDPEADNYNPDATDPATCFYNTAEATDLSGAFQPIDSESNDDPALTPFIYPNPLNEGDLTVNFGEPLVKVTQITVYDLLGKVIFQDQINENQGFSMIPSRHFISEGVYLITILYNDGSNNQQKVMVSK